MPNKPSVSPTQAITSWRDTIPIHPAAEMFPMLPEAELDKLAEEIRRNGLREAVTVYNDLDDKDWWLDGRNRLEALERIGVRPVKKGGHYLIDPERVLPVCAGINYVPVGEDEFDPYTYVISKNYWRRHVPVEERRAIMAEYLRRSPHKSDRQIGRELGHDHKTIAKVRAAQEDVGSIPHVETRTDSKGREQPARKTRTAAVKSVKTKPEPEPEQTDLEDAIAADAETSAAARKAAYAAEDLNTNGAAPPEDALDEDDREAAAAIEQHTQELVGQRAKFLQMLRILVDVAQHMDPSDMVAAINDETEEITPSELGELAGWCTQVGAELCASKKHSKKHSKEAVATGSAEPLAGDDPGPVPEFLRRGGVS